MARPSTIEQLPPDILEQLQELLRDPRVSQLNATAKINAILAAAGYPESVSKSAVNRYSMRMERVGEKLRQSRQVADMWIARLGAQPQGQVGHLVNEILRTLAFDLSLQLHAGAADVDPENLPGLVKSLKELAISAHRLEQAASENIKREEEIRKQAAAELTAKVDAESGGGAITPDRLREIVRESYGV